MWKYDKVLVIYSALTILLSFMSGQPQGMHRYVMAAPIVFLLPARLRHMTDLIQACFRHALGEQFRF